MLSPAKERYPTTAKPSFLDKPIQRGVIKNILDSIEAMKPMDIAEVVSIHQQEITEGIFTELGRNFLTIFYKQVVASKYALGYVLKKDGRVIGYIAGSSNSGKFFKQLLMHNFFQINVIVLKRILTQPSFLPGFVKRVFVSRKERPCAESLAGAVLKEHQTNGYGVILLKKLIDDLRRAGADRIECIVAVNEENPAIVKLHGLYQNGGYNQIKAFRIGDVKYVRYRRYL